MAKGSAARGSPPGTTGSAGTNGRAVDRGTDLIGPPAAREPAEVLLLACAALTDGDLEAAVALYEPDATLSWGEDHAAAGHLAIRQVLSGVMDLRLPLRPGCAGAGAGPPALITGERTLTGLA
jgi:hypothetical protein